MKLLTIDLEMTPNLAHIWQLWGNQHVGLNQLMESSELLCASYKWHHDPDPVFVVGPRYENLYGEAVAYPEATLQELWTAVDEADAVITYNGKKFDIPRMNSAFIEAGLDCPQPYHQIDLYQVVRKTFGWPSMKLDYVAQRLLGEGKVKHEGHELWVKCMAGDPVAWNDMMVYNMVDTVRTEQLYDKLLPWIPGHPNAQLYNDLKGCVKCGSERIQKRGFAAASTGRYQQYQCQSCKGWFRDVRRIDGSQFR